MRRASNREKGQTLIETLITVLFIAVSVIALIRFQAYLAYDNTLTQQKTEATLIGLKKMEQLSDYQVINTTTGYTAYQDIVSGSNTITGVNTTYTLTWTVTSFTNPTYKTIDLVVGWTDKNNVSQSIRLVTNTAAIDPANSASIM